MDYETKPRVIAVLAEYQHWSGFEQQIGAYISQLITELEAESFRQ